MPEPMRIMSIVGARPNFMKVAPLIKAMTAHGSAIEHRLVHTGQHYDERMSDAFFRDLGMPRPDINLGVGSGSHAEQTARVMIAIETELQEFRPDLMIVVGDVNSTIACALTATKLGIRVAHVEAGLRSFDRTMPEEINRLCTDAISDYLFTTDRIANENLTREGVEEGKIHFVGNVMIDSLLSHLPASESTGTVERLGLERGGYGTLTLHRPANVDEPAKLTEIIDALRDSLGSLPIVFPVHPRTRQRIQEFGLGNRFVENAGDRGIWLTEPLGYLEFLNLNQNAKLVMTDSGGLQEESSILGVPCVTIRDNTERPITISEGTNRLAGTSRQGIVDAVSGVFSEEADSPPRPEKWDGKAAVRIIDILLKKPVC